MSASALPPHSAESPAGASPDSTTVLKCKKCKVPLPDAAWKNCAKCRRERTESYNRWKKSAMLRSMNSNSGTSSHPPGPTAPLDRYSNEPSHSEDLSESSRLADDQPRRTSASTVPPPAEAIEYQWSDELIADLLELPPRSVFMGKFSIVADPAVNNSTRAHLFAGQLHAKAVPISDFSQLTSLNAGSSNSCSFVSHCTCQEGCQGRFVVSVDDDRSHPYGVPGQRIRVVIVHPNSPD